MYPDLDAFDIFAAYHLGLLPTGERRFVNVSDIARHFGVGIDEVHGVLSQHGFTSKDVVHSDFDMAEARLDVEMASTVELAREHAQKAFAAFTQGDVGKRDWAAEFEG